VAFLFQLATAQAPDNMQTALCSSTTMKDKQNYFNYVSACYFQMQTFSPFLSHSFILFTVVGSFGFATQSAENYAVNVCVCVCVCVSVAGNISLIQNAILSQIV